MLRGTGVSAGVAQGNALVVVCGCSAPVPRRSIEAAEVSGEGARLDAAVERAAEELAVLRDEVALRAGAREGDIFGAQALVLRDPDLRERVLRDVRERRVNVEAALSEVLEEYARRLEAVPDATLRERAADVRDVGRRVLAALIDQGPRLPDLPEGAVVVAEELLPSVTARLDVERVRAIVTERGNKFSHSAILARSLGIPAVAGLPEATSRIGSGDRLIVDGLSGTVFVNPEPSVEREYEHLAAELREDEEELRAVIGVPSVTRDGTAVPLLANVNRLADVEAALRFEAGGIGLYRTEFAFSARAGFPTEDEQYALYAAAAARFHPRKVAFRLLDVGGDKVLPYFSLPPSRNPSLSHRGVRLLLRHLDLLKPQLRAVLRVSADHPASILLPVVGGLEEVRQAREVVRQAMDELAAAGQRFDRDVPVGAMVEVPSAALTARALAREVDFLSLGTNDLVQYVLAADREDERVAPWYQPLHPGVLRLVDAVAEAARAADRELTICGDMAGDPLHAELLLGLGLRAFSVAPAQLLAVKSAIRRIGLEEARSLAAAAMELGSGAEVEALLAARRAGARDPA